MSDYTLRQFNGTLATGTLLSLTCKNNGPHTFPSYLGTLRKGDSIVLGKRFIKHVVKRKRELVLEGGETSGTEVVDKIPARLIFPGLSIWEL